MKDKTRENLINSDFLVSSYVLLTTLQNNFATVYGLAPLGVELSTIFLIVTNTFLAVVFSDVPSLVRALALSFLLKVFLTRLAEVHSTSESAIQTWRQQQKVSSSWFRKFSRSCQPLRVNVGSFCYVDRKLMLTIMSLIVGQTTNLILTYK